MLNYYPSTRIEIADDAWTTSQIFEYALQSVAFYIETRFENAFDTKEIM